MPFSLCTSAALKGSFLYLIVYRHVPIAVGTIHVDLTCNEVTQPFCCIEPCIILDKLHVPKYIRFYHP
jgi:hypothetical protein